MNETGSTPLPAEPNDTRSAVADKANILLVDDVPENLRVLAEMLLQRGYSPRPVTSAKAALKLMGKIDIDLILLDINMPEMNGFEFCSVLKADARYSDIPIIFLSAADDTAHKVEAFQRGGVDYISKPFQFEEVRARVDTHLNIRRLQLEQQSLLERTLDGTVHTLIECLELAAPQVFVRARAIRDCVDLILADRSVDEPWTFRVAASLSLLGCLALPEEITREVLSKEEHTPEQEDAFRRHAKIGAELLGDIPRLERVAAMVQAQYDDAKANADKEILLGARLLRVSQMYCQARLEGRSSAEIAVEIRNRYPWAKDWMTSLQNFRVTREEDESSEGPISKLPVGAQVLTDVKTTDGRLLLRQGQEVSRVLWLRLSEYVQTQRVENHFVFQKNDGD